MSDYQSALQLAIDAYKAARAEEESGRHQGDLFAADMAAVHGSPPGTEIVQRGPGRPPGSRNRRTDQHFRFLVVTKYGGREPLDMGLAIATLPILAPGVLAGLAEGLGMSRADAAKYWRDMLGMVMPYGYQRQSSLEIRPSGAPGSGDPIPWDDVAEAIDMLDVTPEGSAE